MPRHLPSEQVMWKSQWKKTWRGRAKSSPKSLVTPSDLVLYTKSCGCNDRPLQSTQVFKNTWMLIALCIHQRDKPWCLKDFAFEECISKYHLYGRCDVITTSTATTTTTTTTLKTFMQFNKSLFVLVVDSGKQSVSNGHRRIYAQGKRIYILARLFYVFLI